MRLSRRAFVEGLGFEPDAFQVAAFDALDQDKSVLVAAPTGSGKTLVANYAIHLGLAQGAKAFYTTPLKALSNQKYSDLSMELGRENVGLLTGDTSRNPGAPVLVMTTEVLRNMIYASSPALEGLRYVILDEVHYLQNPYRGAVWEEVIVHAPAGLRLVCLSATVSNAEEVAAWLSAARGEETAAIIEEKRPVELDHLYLVGDRGATEPHLLLTFIEGRANPQASAFDSPALRASHRPRNRSRIYRPRRSEVVERLAAQNMIPAIYFVFSRAGCDDAVASCMRDNVRLTTPAERGRIRAIAEAHLDAVSDADLQALGFGQWVEGLAAGLASHHAGLIPPFKEAVEECFAAGLVKVVFATETLSLGINMPARAVVIDSLSKFTGERHEMLTPGEYTQLTGRAGRRGIDNLGFAVVVWSPWVSFGQVASLAGTRTYELKSSFRPNYNMAANLVRRYEPKVAHRLLNLSFAQFRADSEVVQLEARLERTAEALAQASLAATCELGDVASYRDAERGMRAAASAGLGTPGPKAQTLAALASLRPGDVLDYKGRALAVLATSRRRGGGVRVAVTGVRGHKQILGISDFEQPPKPVAKIELPVPYDPSDPGFLKATGQRLSKESNHVASHGGNGSKNSGPSPARQELSSHPVASCPQLRSHLRSLERSERLGAEVARLESQVRDRHDSLARQLDRVLAMLGERGYVDGWRLTPKGELLARIYHEQDLLVAECLDAGLLDGLGLADLAAVCSTFVFEPRGRDIHPSRADPGREPMARWVEIQKLWRGLEADESSHRLPLTRPPDASFMGLARQWASGRSLAKVMADGSISGGDFVRNIKQLADLLGQIADTAPEPSTATAAREAAAALLRGAVAASGAIPDAGVERPAPDEDVDGTE